MALRFADIPAGQQARAYWPYPLALLFGLMLIICIPEPSRFLSRSAGLTR
jgi:TRAP-type C4-dicarboxylate transport system permease large subunit